LGWPRQRVFTLTKNKTNQAADGHKQTRRDIMNSALKRKQRKEHRDTIIANVIGFAILAMTVAAIYVINYQIILIRYGA